MGIRDFSAANIFDFNAGVCPALFKTMLSPLFHNVPLLLKLHYGGG